MKKIIPETTVAPEETRVCPGFEKYRKQVLLVCWIVLSVGMAHAQCPMSNDMYQSGEKIYFDVYFKWGILMPKAGSAILTMEDVEFQGKKAVRQQLSFRTTSMFDKIFKMRDTINTYYTPSFEPLFYEKHALEDGYYLVDEMTYLHQDGLTRIPTKRYDRKRVKIDTTHVYEGGCVFDLLSVTWFLRSIDTEKLSIGDEFPIALIMGRDVIKIRYRYAGQSIVERGEYLKYKTLKFDLDVEDEAVSQTKNAFEIWVSDDENQLPIKIRAKLKIGAAEAYFVKVKGSKYPMTSEFKIPRR